MGSSVTADDVRRFLVAVKAGINGRPVADSYVEGFRKAIAAMFTWTVEEGLLKKSPTAHVARFVCERRLPTVFSNIEVGALIDAAQPRSRLGSRNQAMFLLMFDTGIRIGELETATVRGLDLERGELKVHGKSRRERVVPLSVPVRAALVSYLNRARPATLFAATDALFLGRDGQPLTANAVRQVLRRAKRRTGMTKRVHPHAFRSSFATHYMLNGGDQATAMEIMGIRSAQVFKGYVNVSLADVHAQHASASPVQGLLRGA